MARAPESVPGPGRVRIAVLVTLCLLPRPGLAEGDPAKGEGVFLNRCSECHATQGDQVKIGPPLTGLFGRTSGSWPGFPYSQAMATAGIVWDAESLAQFLPNPRGFVPQTKMNFNGLKRPGEAEDLIAYLATATAE
ncbi:MAG: cytochrome c family protein [Tabrizicola sp.]|nr:cytochrome c family protein [Tabrizicola sp.]